MRKGIDILIVLVSISFCIVLTSCKKEMKRPDFDFIEIAEETASQIIISEINVPGNMELVADTEKYFVVKLVDLYNDKGFRELVIDIDSRCAEGKFIYSRFIGINEVDDKQKVIYGKGYMNRNFTFLTSALYQEAFPFKDGRAIVKDKNGYGVIDIDGNIVLQCKYQDIPEISISQIRVAEAVEYELINHLYFDKTSGELLHSISQKYNSSTGELLLIKKDANNTETEISGITGWESDIRIAFKDKESELQGFTDGFGRIIVKAQYSQVFPYSNGLARFVKNNRYGYLDNKGKIVIENLFEEAYDFSYGAARVMMDGLYGYIDSTGSLIIDCQFKKADDFFKDGAAVSKNGALWGYIAISGNLVIKDKYPLPSKFSHGIAPVYDVNKRSYIYITGDGKPIFDEMDFFKAGEIDDDGFAIAYNMIVKDAKGGTVKKDVFYMIIVK